jgi:septation ring formation regulator EzrA
MERLSFEDLVKIEPRLDDLLTQIKNEKPPTKWQECEIYRWYGIGGDRSGYKQKMVKLVGWFAEKHDTIIKSQQAYDVAYRTLNNTLPSCDVCKVVSCDHSTNYDQYYEERDDSNG